MADELKTSLKDRTHQLLKSLTTDNLRTKELFLMPKSNEIPALAKNLAKKIGDIILIFEQLRLRDVHKDNIKTRIVGEATPGLDAAGVIAGALVGGNITWTAIVLTGTGVVTGTTGTNTETVIESRDVASTKYGMQRLCEMIRDYRLYAAIIDRLSPAYKDLVKANKMKGDLIQVITAAMRFYKGSLPMMEALVDEVAEGVVKKVVLGELNSLPNLDQIFLGKFICIIANEVRDGKSYVKEKESEKEKEKSDKDKEKDKQKDKDNRAFDALDDLISIHKDLKLIADKKKF